jgi:hypothetical protein
VGNRVGVSDPFKAFKNVWKSACSMGVRPLSFVKSRFRIWTGLVKPIACQITLANKRTEGKILPNHCRFHQAVCLRR